MNDDPQTRLEIAGQDVVLRLSGDLSLESVSVVRQAWNEALASDAEIIHIDMGDATFIDSSGLGALVYGLDLADRRGIPTDFRHVPRRIYRIFEITGLASTFDVRIAPETAPDQPPAPGV